jgi:hypothetical protein
MPREDLERHVNPADIVRSGRLASSRPAETRSKGVSWEADQRLERGPSPDYSAPSNYPAEEASTIENSSDDAGSIDSASQQLLDEANNQTEAIPEGIKILDSSKPGQIHQRREIHRPVTEAYEQQEALSSIGSVPLANHHKVLRQLSGAHQDLEFCRRVHKLRAQIIDFAQAYVVEIKRNKPQPSVQFLCSNIENAKLVRYIGFLAQGGANKLDSWQELLTDKESLTALVVGIVGHALKEHVFSALWFGGHPEDIDILEKLQEEEKDEDGK